MKTSRSSVTLAYELWKVRGYPQVLSEQDWLEAERLAAGTAEAEPSRSVNDDESIASFPASDPTASHAPDVLPATQANNGHDLRQALTARGRHLRRS